MKQKEFEAIFRAQLKRCEHTLVTKGREYATEDRLYNFKVAGALQSETPAEALCGMMAKHIVSIFDLVREKDVPMDVWDEKIGDALNYLFLLRAVVEEKSEGE